jgi:hypothetical protein
MKRLAVYDQAPPTRRVRLLRPINVDGALVSHVEVRPATSAEFEDKRAGNLTAEEFVAACAGLSLGAAGLFGDADHARLVETIADLNAETHQMILTARRGQFRVIDGALA